MGMPPASGIDLSTSQKRELHEFMKGCRKAEYRRAVAILLRSDGERVEDVARHLSVSTKTVSVWTAAYMYNGLDGITSKNRGRIVSADGMAARERIPGLLHAAPEGGNVMLGRWTASSLRMALAGEGVAVSLSTVRRILCKSGYVWKKPKLRAPGSLKKDYRKRKIVENYKRMAPALRSRGVATYFEDEKWMELLAKLQCAWMKKGTELIVPTPGYTARWNFFISLDYVTGAIVWNSFGRRRNDEFRVHLSNVIAHMKRDGMRRAILFPDKASYHDTPEVKRFLKKHPELTIKRLPKKDPNVNPVELLVNRRMASAVQCNRCYYSREELREAGSQFLSHFNAQYAVA